MEQRLYEHALLAEMSRTELENMKAGKAQSAPKAIRAKIDNIIQMVETSPVNKDKKQVYVERLSALDTAIFEDAYATAGKKITSMDLKYMICFAAGMDTQDISVIFNIEPDSVHTVRYRIRKKFADTVAFMAIL
jgi:hypothetical protein